MKSLVALLLLLFCLAGCATKSAEVTDFQPIIDSNGADPWIFKKDDVYYYTKTTGNNVTLWKSNQLTTVAFGQPKVIWDMPAEFESAWAPELHYIYDQWVVYVALNKAGETHKMYALTNQSSDPFEGDWELHLMEGMTAHFAIDGTVLSLGNENYYIWSGWEGYENIAQNLYITKMTSPYAVSGERKLISVPEYEWEKRQEPYINEGPQIFVFDGVVNLVYSASGSWDDDYALGLLTLEEEQDPLVATNWKKSTEPIFSKTDSVFGPGHNGFVLDGQNEPWMIYHAARWSHSGWERSIRLQPLTVEKGMISQMVPVADTERQALPRGDVKRVVYQAKNARFSNGIRKNADGVEGFADPAEEIEFSIKVPEEGEYTVLVYVKTIDNYDPQNVISGIIAINGEETLHSIYPADYYQPIGLTTHLDKGDNKVTFRLDIGVDEVAVKNLEVLPSMGE